MKLKFFGAVAAAAMLAGAANADSSFTFDITGTIPTICVGNNNSLGPVETVDLMAGVTAQTMGSVTYVCNAPGGFTRTISSANAGKLVRVGSSGGSGNEVPYLLGSGGGSGLSFAGTALTTPKISTLSGSTAFLAGQTASLNVSVASQATTGASGLPTTTVYAGTYTDTVTVAVTAL